MKSSTDKEALLLLTHLIEFVYRLLWGDLFTLPVGGGIGISPMVVLLFTAGIWFTLRTRLLPVRLFRDMIAAVCEKNQNKEGLSSFQTLVVSTATRVGMGNLVGVVAAVSAGGAGAVFWMWVTALLGASTSFIESTLAQKYRQPDPLYGGWRGGPAYYLHVLAERRRGKKLKRSVVAALFAVSGLICWCGISQVISNSVSSAFENAFHIPPLTTTLVLTAIAAVIVLRKNATVKSLDVMVPIMAVCYFVITVGIVLFNLPKLPAVFGRIFTEAFGLRQAVAGGFGAVLMNGVKRGLFSNEAGSGSAPCAAAAAECDLYRLTNGKGLPGFIGGAHIGVGGAAHAEDADDAAHAGAKNEGDSAGCFNKQRKQCCNDQHNDGDRSKLCFQEHGSAAADNARHFGHFCGSFVHLLNAEKIEDDVGKSENDQPQDNQIFGGNAHSSITFLCFGIA